MSGEPERRSFAFDLLNPRRLAIPWSNLRLNPVALLMLGAVFYLAAAAGGFKAVLLVFAVLTFLYGWPLLELGRAQRGRHSWLYPQVTLARVNEALARPDRMGLTAPEAEVVSYLARRPSQLSDQFSVEVLADYDRLPAMTQEGREERRRALESLLERGLVKHDRKSPDVVALDLRALAPLAG